MSLVRGCGLLLVGLVALARPGHAGWDPLQKARRAAQTGQQALAAGDSTLALQSWLRAQSLDPDDPHIGLGLAETLFRTGQFKSSLGQYRSLADHPARSQLALYNAGTSAFAAQDLEEALELYTRALVESEGPPDPDLLYNLELTQQLLEMAQSQPQQGEGGEPSEEGEQNQEQQQDPTQNQSQQEPSPDQEAESQEGEQQPQEEESPAEQPEEQETEGEEQTEDAQSEPAPPDSSQVPPPEPASADSMLALPEGMTPQEAMRLLDALDHDEEELRRSIQRRLRGADTKSKKDW